MDEGSEGAHLIAEDLAGVDAEAALEARRQLEHREFLVGPAAVEKAVHAAEHAFEKWCFDFRS